MPEYKMLTYLAEFQEKTNNEYFDFKEFQIFLDAKTIEEDDIVSTVLTDGFIECLKNPVVITEETEKVIIDILTKQAFIDDVDNLIKNNVNSSKSSCSDFKAWPSVLTFSSLLLWSVLKLASNSVFLLSTTSASNSRLQVGQHEADSSNSNSSALILLNSSRFLSRSAATDEILVSIAVLSFYNL